MESYANAGDGVRGVIARMQARRGDDGMRASLMRAYARWRHDARDIERGIAEAGQRLELDLDAVDVRAAPTPNSTCPLLMHGADDQYIPFAAAHAMVCASPHVRYRKLADENHINLTMRIDLTDPPKSLWQKKHAAG